MRRTQRGWDNASRATRSTRQRQRELGDVRRGRRTYTFSSEGPAANGSRTATSTAAIHQGQAGTVALSYKNDLPGTARRWHRTRDQSDPNPIQLHPTTTSVSEQRTAHFTDAPPPRPHHRGVVDVDPRTAVLTRRRKDHQATVFGSTRAARKRK